MSAPLEKKTAVTLAGFIPGGKVTPFALKSSDQFRPGPQPQAGTWLYQQRMRDVMRLNAELDDRGKMSAEYWDDAVGSETLPGHWNRLAEEISNRIGIMSHGRLIFDGTIDALRSMFVDGHKSLESMYLAMTEPHPQSSPPAGT